MYFNDHSPPYFHARYAEHEALIAIESLEVIEGRLPRRAMALVLEWAAAQRAALRDDWQQARRGEPLRLIPPLE
jgi:hypothetical protein